MIDSYKTLPVGKYLDIQAAANDDSLSPLDLQVRVIAILSDLSEREVLNLPIADYSERAGKTAFLQETPKSIGRIASSYTLPGGWTLIPTQDIQKITAAQYIDFQGFAPEGDARFVELLSVFLVPEGKAYNDGYDVLEVQKAIREHLPMSDALALTAFFLQAYAASMRTTLRSSERMARRIRDKKKREEILRQIRETRIRALEKISRIGGGGSAT